jgi:outer membrane protein
MLLPLLAGLALAGAAQAQTADFKPKAAGVKILNVRLSEMKPHGRDPITTLAGASTGLEADVGYDVMPTLGLSYFFTDNIAVEVIAGTTKHTVRAKGGATNVKVKDTWVLPPVVSVQYHFAPDSKISPYVGAGVNYMLFYGGSNKNGFNLKIDDGFGLAAQAGLDIATSGPWSINLDAKKIFFSSDAVDRKSGIKTKVHLDPWVLSAGFGYRS